MNKKWNLSLYYEEYRAFVTTVKQCTRLAFLRFSQADLWPPRTGSFMVGLSNGAPNYGLTAGLSYRF